MNPIEDKTWDVFLAHNSSDKSAVERLAKKLRDEQGLTVWFDVWELRPGLSWQDGLEEGIRGSRAGAVLVGKDGFGPWEKEEMKALLQLAVSEKLPVIPVLLPGAAAKPELPVFLANRHYVDLRDGLKKAGIDQLVWGITGVRPDSHGAEATATTSLPEPHPDLKDSIAHLPRPGAHFVGRDDELKLLDNAWLDSKTNIVEFVAFGGVGKSALVAEWLKRMQADGYRGAERVFGHSFYSQGSREDAQASADSFLDQALRFFGDPDPTEGSPWDKGERLARLVRQQPTLLILDGVEPLQTPGRLNDAGQVRDPGLQALVVELAGNMNGLLVISTRARVRDIGGWAGTSVVSHELDHLSVEAGSALLAEIGVQGTAEELAEAVREVDGHALSVTLVGKYVVFAASGHVQDRFEIGLPRVDMVRTDDESPLAAAVTPDVGEIGHELEPDAGRRRNTEHTSQTFSRIMQRYEVWLSGLQDREGDMEVSGRLALEIARLTGLFDRPITAGEFAALLGSRSRETSDEAATDRSLTTSATGAIPGLTDLASAASEGEVNLAIGRLVEYGLITKATGSRIRLSVPSWPDPAASEVVLDAHPLIREFFAKRLEHQPDAQARDTSTADQTEATSLARRAGVSTSVREAHRRLYEHLKQSAPERPDNLNDMMPLYHAVAHGCKAELRKQCLEEVFYARIWHEGKHFSWRQLGAFGAELAAVANFFQQAWTEPAAELPDPHKGLVLNAAFLALRGVGRLEDAVAPIGTRIKLAITTDDWLNGALNASNLSELSLTLGDASSAVRHGEQSVELADRSGDAFQRKTTRARLAAALFCAGEGSGGGEEVGSGGGTDSSPPSSSTRPLKAFREAEAIQQERQPEYPLLYSVSGYQYCELLLEQLAASIQQLAGSRPDQAQRRSGNEECERQGASRRFDEEEEPAASALPLTEVNVTEGAPAALGSVRPAGDSGEDRKREAYATAARELQSEIESLRNRAETTLGWYGDDESMGILDFALDHLTLGRTWQLSALLECDDWSPLPHSSPGESAETEPTALAAGAAGGSAESKQPEASACGSLEQAEHHLTQSVTLLRQAGTQHHLPRGLLHRAALWREMLELRERQGAGRRYSEIAEAKEPAASALPLTPDELLARAERDLSEAETIANRGSMLIWQIEAALERAWLCLTLHQINWEGEAPAEPPSGHATHGSAGASPSRWLDLAREKLNETRCLVKQSEKPYEPHVPDWDDWDPPEYVGVFKQGETVGYHCRNADIELLQAEIDALARG